MRRKYTRDLTGVDIAVTGVPFDQAVTHRPGTRLGPAGIRQASAENAWGPVYPWNFDPFETLGVIDYGDCFFDWGLKENFPATLEAHATEIISSGVEMITLGGDHYISYPLLKAHAKKYGPLALVHFDAHRDMEPDSGGRIDHGTMFGYAIREGADRPRTSQCKSASAPASQVKPLTAFVSFLLVKCTTHRQSMLPMSSVTVWASPRLTLHSTSTASIHQPHPAPARPFPVA